MTDNVNLLRSAYLFKKKHLYLCFSLELNVVCCCQSQFLSALSFTTPACVGLFLGFSLCLNVAKLGSLHCKGFSFHAFVDTLLFFCDRFIHLSLAALCLVVIFLYSLFRTK